MTTDIALPMYYILDRNRIVDYNGAEYVANMYECSCCGVMIMRQCMVVNYCSNCGVKFEDFEDRSM